MSRIVDLAEQVKEHIQGLTLSDSHTTERVYLLDVDRSSVSGLMVHVLPTPPVITPYSRSSNQWDIDVNVAFTTRPSDTTLATIDELMSDVETMMGSFTRTGFPAGGETHTVSRVTQESIYDDSMLKDESVFQAVFTIGFRATR